MITAAEALSRLKDGNRRSVERLRGLEPCLGGSAHIQLTQQPGPFAIILGCSDARVPVETVFDQGLGDLLVIRVADNIVVPGHSRCGAVQATLEQPHRPAEKPIPEHPLHRGAGASVYRGAAEDRTGPRRGCVCPSGGARQRRGVGPPSALRLDPDVLERLIPRNGLAVVGAEYPIETGEVEFFVGAGE